MDGISARLRARVTIRLKNQAFQANTANLAATVCGYSNLLDMNMRTKHDSQSLWNRQIFQVNEAWNYLLDRRPGFIVHYQSFVTYSLQPQSPAPMMLAYYDCVTSLWSLSRIVLCK